MDDSTIKELANWQLYGTFYRTFPNDERFLTLEKLGIAERYDETLDYIDWKINRDKAKELHNQRLRMSN